MLTTRRAWIALSLVVGLLWLFPLAVVGERVAYGRHSPEWLHACLAAYGMAVLFGAPLAAIILTGSIWSAKGGGEPVPTFAFIAGVAAWILAVIPWLAFAV